MCCVQNGAALIDALTTVLRNVTKEETVQYVLALLDDIVTSVSAPGILDSTPTRDSHACYTVCGSAKIWWFVGKGAQIAAQILQARLLTRRCLHADDPGKARLFHEERARVNASDPYAIFLRCRPLLRCPNRVLFRYDHHCLSLPASTHCPHHLWFPASTQASTLPHRAWHNATCRAAVLCAATHASPARLRSFPLNDLRRTHCLCVFCDPERPCLQVQHLCGSSASSCSPLTVRRLLQRTDWFTQEKACKLLTAVLGARPSKEIHLANGAGPSASSAAAAVSTAPPIVAAASESVQVRR